MGKRNKRLTMAKYAKKYASVRASVARLKGEHVVEEPVNTAPLEEETPVITPVLSMMVEEVEKPTEQVEKVEALWSPEPVVEKEEKVEVLDVIEKELPKKTEKTVKKKATTKAKGTTSKRTVKKKKDKG